MIRITEKITEMYGEHVQLFVVKKPSFLFSEKEEKEMEKYVTKSKNS